MKNKNNFHQNPLIKNFINLKKTRRKVNYSLSVHYHPFVSDLIETVNIGGLPALLDPNYHISLAQPLIDRYDPGEFTKKPFPIEEIDVSDHGPYAIYNWELFFHAPLTIAVHLSKNQRFAEAQNWFHYIFDPTCNDKSIPAPERFWKFLRFRQETKFEFIQDMLTRLAEGKDEQLKKQMEQSINEWRKKPFQPHVIARARYSAYQLNAVMKYLDNLISWGDNLFRQDTMETLNEATQIYVLAANILGPKPQKIPARGKRTSLTYSQLKEQGIDSFGNSLRDLENDIIFSSQPSSGQYTDSGATAVANGIFRSLYFCVPQNDQLLAYWDTIDDRLFKLRHCMNLEGMVRHLPLFDPQIDPGMLVKAAASGLDIGSIVNNINQPLSTVRGPVLLQKALEICSEVKSLGAALLSALEKKDGESISLLRQKHELNISKLTQDTKFLQWKEAENATESLLSSRTSAFERYRHYKKILGTDDTEINKLKTIDLARKDLNETVFDEVYAQYVGQYAVELSKEDYRKETSVGGVMEFAGNVVNGLSSALSGGKFGSGLGETLPLNKNENAELNVFLPAYDTFNTLSAVLDLASPLAALIPQFHGHATPLGVGVAVAIGGQQAHAVVKDFAGSMQQIANAFHTSADRASKMAGYYRRAEDYVLQANLATNELMQYGRQIIASLIREQITKKEYENQIKLIEQTEATLEFLQSKFTNEDLYNWMQGEITKIYFSSYKFAFDIAKKSEQTLKYELMRPEFDSLNLIKFGYWDSTRKGLLSGESLYMDLKRLELAYLENTKREYEISKHISLHRLNPKELLTLKATGSCEFEIPEWIYDLDSPGQFMRRIKTVSISIPCITGPYTSVHAKLSLLKSEIRISSLKGSEYKRTASEDSRFRDFTGAIQSVVTSSAQNDSGLFETNLNDSRYLPFEGAGAISTWKIELPNDFPQFDFETISDVILHIRYTCREAGHLADSVKEHINEILQAPNDGLLQLFNINSDFANEWNKFKTAANVNDQKLTLNINKNNFPYWIKPQALKDGLAAEFYTINENKLVQMVEKTAFNANADGGWSLTIDSNKEVFFKFLNDNKMIYMAVYFT